VRKCYVAALALLPDDGTLVSQGVAALSEYLEQLPSVSIPFTESDDKFDFKFSMVTSKAHQRPTITSSSVKASERSSQAPNRKSL
jgi:hypothetical protein